MNYSLSTPYPKRTFGEEEVGFRFVASGPLVRSSYRAGEFFVEAMIRGEKASTEKFTAAGPLPAQHAQQAAAAAQTTVAGKAVSVPEFWV